MPEEGVELSPSNQLLTTEEILRLVWSAFPLPSSQEGLPHCSVEPPSCSACKHPTESADFPALPQLPDRCLESSSWVQLWATVSIAARYLRAAASELL